MKNIYSTLIILIFLFSCSYPKEKYHLENIKISLQELHQIELGAAIEYVKLIPLETNENCLIKHIDKIIMHDNKIYILDRRAGNILIYNNLGNFLYKISKQGKGFGEYIMIADFDIKPDTGDIYILDGMTDKLLVFHENIFIKDFSLKFGSKVLRICFIDDNRIIFENQLSLGKDEWKYRLIVTDENLKILDKKIKYEKSVGLIMSPVSAFSKYNQEISYQPVYKDTLFHIINENVTPRYRLDFGKNWIDEEYLYSKNINPMNFIHNLKKSNSIYFLNTIESSGHIFIYFSYKDDNYAYLYDKDTKKGAFIKNYMNSSCGHSGLPMIPNGDLFVGIINPYEISNIDEKKLAEANPDFKIWKANNNAILSYIKFKRIN